MDEQENTAEDELGLATDTDEIADTEATDTDKESDEQGQDTLDLEETEQDKGKAEIAKEKLVSDTVKKIKSGDKTLDDIPKDQAWLKQLAEAELGVNESEDDIIDRKLNEREATKKFDSLKKELNVTDLTADQKSTLKGKYKSLRDKGLSKLDALEMSMEIAGVDLEEAMVDSKRYAARMRTPGSYTRSEGDPESTEKNEGFGVLAKKGNPEKTWDYLKKQL